MNNRLSRCSGSEEQCCTSNKPPVPSYSARLEVMSSPSPCKDNKDVTPLSRMLKPQLLEEAMRLGMTVHPKWTVIELRAVIREHKAATGESDLSNRMRKINSLNLPELREKATRLGVDYPDKATKGILFKLIREAVNTLANTLMTIGRWRGCEYHEIPQDYGRWALEEITRSVNCHPDLVRYARWWQAEQEAKAAKVKIPDEDVDASYFDETRRPARATRRTPSARTRT